MFVEDLRNDFYNLLLGNRVLLLVHYDIDAICTCKILQNLFKCDNISYTLVPVGGISELKVAYEENNEEVKYVVLINCGGTIDLVDILQPEEDVIFFVLDSHKPTDVCNVYSDGQVRLVHRDSEESIPNFEDIFRDDEEEEEEAQGRGLEGAEEAAERRRARREWEQRRDQLMFNYTQFSYRGKPSAYVALEVSWLVSRCGVEEQWAAGVGGAALDVEGARAPAAALLDAELLQRLLARGPAPLQQARVVVEKELCLPLYRRWSLQEALRHSPALGPLLRAPHALNRLLAHCGLPLAQARGAWPSMDVSLRRAALTSLEEGCTALRLPCPARAALLLRRPLCPDLPALDLVYIIAGLIEHESIPRAEGFQLSLSALECSAGDNEARRAGAEAARRALAAVSRVATAALQGRVRRAGPFDYFTLQEGSPEAGVVRGPLWLGAAARFLSACLGGARAVLVSAPCPAPSPAPRCLLLGVPPRSNHHNLLGAALEQAAARSGVQVARQLGDPPAVTLDVARRAQLLDALTALLA